MIRRRDFLSGAGGAAGLSLAARAAASPPPRDSAPPDRDTEGRRSPAAIDAPQASARSFNSSYSGEQLAQIAFPLGGMGAGMVCIEGAGGLSKFSLRHRPETEADHQVFAAVAIKGTRPIARVLEGPVPAWKLRPQFPSQSASNCWGLPRFQSAQLTARFPFADVRLADAEVPLDVSITGWSPFSPRDADNASLPVAGLEYHFANMSEQPVEAIFSFNAENFLAQPPSAFPFSPSAQADRIEGTRGGFILYGAGSTERPADAGRFAAWVDEPSVAVDHAWPVWRLDIAWRRFAAGQIASRPPARDEAATGASLFVPFTVAPGATRTIRLHLAWYVPRSALYEPEVGLRGGKWVPYPDPKQRYQPWYAGRFADIDAVKSFWQRQYEPLRASAAKFSRTLYDSTLPDEVVEAVTANLAILKSTTVLRQPDGRLWGWEGSMSEQMGDRTGISGTSTHVWNYAQAVPHLFPELERGLRETEFGPCQTDEGLQYSRAPLPIRPVEQGHTIPDGPAADGQLGGLIKLYREWRISGDTNWLRRLWPRVRSSLDYCIRTWDPDRLGRIEEPHFTTYDAHLWGRDSLCTGLYVGALAAGTLMAEALGDSVPLYHSLLGKALAGMETDLFNGEYFYQRTRWSGLRTRVTDAMDWPAAYYQNSQDYHELVDREGPIGQYGTGCLADGVMGLWLCGMAGLPTPVNGAKIAAHLTAVYRHNFSRNLADHANLARPMFGCNSEAGLLLCTWPHGNRPTVPMIYADEVWTGVEYQVAGHLISIGKVAEGLEIVRAARFRYDGRTRNPFSEVEAGHWYARAMSSYGLLQAWSGARFDKIERILYLRPAVPGDFRTFLSTADGYGTVGVRNGQPFVEVIDGSIPYDRIEYSPFA